MTGPLEIRESADGHEWVVEGISTTYDAPYEVQDRLGRYSETVKRGTFAAALAGREDVALRVQHDHRPAPLATTKSGTMTLFDRAEGLAFRATLPKADPDSAAAVSKVQRKILDSLSIGFRVDRDDWSSDGSRRTITEGHLDEISLVFNPANPAAIVTSVRAEEAALGYTVRVTSGGMNVVERSAYAAHQLAALGRLGQAIAGPDGGWRYPSATAEDLRESIAAAQAANAGRDVRRYLTRRAIALGLSRLIPSSWQPTALSAARSGPSSVEVAAKVFLRTGILPAWAKTGRPPTPVGSSSPSEPRTEAERRLREFVRRTPPPSATAAEMRSQTAELRRRAGIKQ